MKKRKLEKELASCRATNAALILDREAVRLENSENRSEEVGIRELAIQIRVLLEQATSKLAQFDMEVKRRFAPTWEELRDLDEPTP